MVQLARWSIAEGCSVCAEDVSQTLLVCGNRSFQHEMLFKHVCNRFCCTQASKCIGVSLWWQNPTL